MSTLKTMYAAQVNSPYTTTLGEISASDTAVVVADASVLPTTLPYLLTFGYDKSASETVLVTAVSGNTLTITRGVDGNALLWVAGTKVARIFTAKDLNDVQENIRALNSGKQENLTFDTTPTADSTNPVTSGGIKAALNLKANSATLASHTGNTNNPHAVTAAQVGATTPEQVDTAIREVCDIGDFKTTVGTPNENWLLCNGEGIYSKDYPVLAPLLKAAHPFQKRVSIPSENYDAISTYVSPYVQGSAYYGGNWGVAACGYNTNTSNIVNLPVVYFASDPEGEWVETKLSDDPYYLSGIVYNNNWYRWVAFGYKVVSDTECYPYMFYCTSTTGTWYSKQISSTVCKVTTGCYANGVLILIGVGCGEDNDGYLYSFTTGSYPGNTITETVITTAGEGSARGLSYGNGYWGFTDRNHSIWYTTDTTGTWTKNQVTSSFYLRDFKYGDGLWVAAGYQSSGGRARLCYSTDITGSFTDVGTTLSINYSGQTLGYSNGVWILLGMHTASNSVVIVSTDGWKTYEEKRFEDSMTQCPSCVCVDGKWLVTHMHALSVLKHPEADAVLPEMTPEVGKTYIRAL